MGDRGRASQRIDAATREADDSESREAKVVRELLDVRRPVEQRALRIGIRQPVSGSVRGDHADAQRAVELGLRYVLHSLSLIHISEPTRLGMISYAVFC